MYKKITKTVVKEIHTYKHDDTDHDEYDEEIVTTVTTPAFPKDTLILDVPLLLQLLVHAREYQPADVQVQLMVQKIIELCNSEAYNKPLSLVNYEEIIAVAKAYQPTVTPTIPLA